MTRLQALQSSAVGEAALQDVIVRAFAEELEETVKLLNRRIRALLLQFQLEDGRLVSTQTNLERALSLRAELLRALEDAGVTELSRAGIDEPLDRLAVRVLSNRIGDAAVLTPFDLDALAAFKELRLAQLLDLDADAAAAVWRTVLDGVVGARPVAQLLDDVEDVLESSAAEARTVYDTAVSTYSRQVDQLHATGEPDELFVYVGPADIKTRAFCERHVGRVYARSEIDTMDNGQLPNVLLTGGGYNCRHAWKRVSVLDAELQELHRSGTRIPFVEEQLKAVTR